MEELKKLLQAIGFVFVLGILILLLFFLFTLNENIGNLKTPQQEWELVWSDEFNYSGLPTDTLWTFIEGDGCPELCGWGNNEQQFYTRNRLKNARVENNKLIIEAHAEKMGTRDFSSAKLISKDKQNMLDGKLVIRCKNPVGLGTWPAIWMMPVTDSYGGWPKSGEIDIMEHVGYAKDSIYGTIHSEAFNHMIGTQKAGEIYIPDNESAFRDYSLEWSQEGMRWFVDSTMYHEYLNLHESYKEWPFDQEFYLILNLAVGGNWGGKMGIDSSAFPARFEIDYVRYFQKK